MLAVHSRGSVPLNSLAAHLSGSHPATISFRQGHYSRGDLSASKIIYPYRVGNTERNTRTALRKNFTRPANMLIGHFLPGVPYCSNASALSRVAATIQRLQIFIVSELSLNCCLPLRLCSRILHSRVSFPVSFLFSKRTARPHIQIIPSSRILQNNSF